VTPPDARPRKKRWLHAAVAIAVLAGIAYWVDLEAVAAALLSLPGTIVLGALLLATCDRFLMAYKWRHLVLAGGARLSFPSALRIYYQAVASGRLIPAALGGDVVRAYFASLAGVPGGLAVSALVLEKLIALLASVSLALCGLVYLGSQLPAEIDRGLIMVFVSLALLVGFAAVALALYAPAHEAGRTLLASVTKRWPLPQRLQGMLGKVSRSLLDYRGQVGVLFQNAALALSEHGLQLFKLGLIAAGLGIATGNLAIFAIFAVALFVRRLTGVFENWGLGEGSAILILVLFGIEAELAVALFVANFAVSTLAILPGIVLFYTHPAGRPVGDNSG
jgi:glycosyltransferase 2 family protein